MTYDDREVYMTLTPLQLDILQSAINVYMDEVGEDPYTEEVRNKIEEAINSLVPEKFIGIINTGIDEQFEFNNGLVSTDGWLSKTIKYNPEYLEYMGWENSAKKTEKVFAEAKFYFHKGDHIDVVREAMEKVKAYGHEWSDEEIEAQGV